MRSYFQKGLADEELKLKKLPSKLSDNMAISVDSRKAINPLRTL